MVVWKGEARARAGLGAGCMRGLRCVHEDGVKAVAAIEKAAQARNAVDMVVPAHRLKGESLQFGAEPLAALAEHIEKVARRCVEIRQEPDELIADVVRLRPMFDQTLAQIDREASPLMERRPAGGFGRKAPTSFGQG